MLLEDIQQISEVDRIEHTHKKKMDMDVFRLNICQKNKKVHWVHFIAFCISSFEKGINHRIRHLAWKRRRGHGWSTWLLRAAVGQAWLWEETGDLRGHRDWSGMERWLDIKGRHWTGGKGCGSWAERTEFTWGGKQVQHQGLHTASPPRGVVRASDCWSTSWHPLSCLGPVASVIVPRPGTLAAH